MLKNNKIFIVLFAIIIIISILFLLVFKPSIEKFKKAEIIESTNLIGQREFIGRQPPVDYIEPVGSDRFEFQLEFKDTYQSNIVVIAEEIWDMNIYAYEWYNYSPKPATIYTQNTSIHCIRYFNIL